jgi:hypothetical protein
MRHIIIVLFLLPIVAFGQYPINVRNIQTGYQTSGEGLFFRGNGYPNYTPTDSLRRHGTFMHIDTVNVRIWTYMQDSTNADSGWVKIFPINVPPAVLNGEVVGPIANNKLGIVDRVRFDITYTPPFDTLGVMWFDANSETVNAIINGGTRYQLGEELFYPIIINKSGSAILKGQLVMVDPVTPISGDHIRVVPAVNNGTYPSTTIMGVAASQIENDSTGLITWFGYVSELKQSEIAQTGITLDIGDILYPSTTQPGRYTDIAPSSPSHKSSIALVVRKPNGNNNNITILVRPWLAPKLDDLSDVNVTGRIINSGLLWNGVKWKATTNQIPTIATGNEDYLVKFKGTDVATGEITIGNSVVKESTGSIGIDITPTEKLDVNGTLRVRNTNKPVTTTKLLGVNDNGVVQEVSVPSGLSGNSLVITGNTDLSFTGTTSPVTLNSSTGTDVTITAGSNVSLSQTGNNLTISSTNSGGTVTGTGDVNKIPKWTTTTALGNSVIQESSDNIGIGKVPTFKLDVAGDALINGARIGLGSGGITTNLAFGNNSLNANTTGTNNVAIGANALLTNDIASNNLAIGASALRNYAIVTTGGGTGNNTAIGGSALNSLVKDVAASVAGNTAIGGSAMIFTKNSNENTAVGVNAMRHSEGEANVAIGNASLASTDPNPNLPRYRTGVLNNVTIGAGTLQTFGTAGTAGNIDISSNVAIGRSAANTVSNNRALTRGIYIGAYSGVSAGTTDVTNEIVIGSGTSGASNSGNGSNTTTIGNSSTTATYVPAGNMRIGSTVAPTERLDVTGTAKATMLAVNTNGFLTNINNYYALGSEGDNIWIGNGGQSSTWSTLTYQGSYNVSLGGGALFNNSTGFGNMAIGSRSLQLNTIGSDNVGVGNQTLGVNVSGYQNVAIGSQAMFYNNSGEENVAIGFGAFFNSNSRSNVGIGYGVQYAKTTGGFDVAIGWNAGRYQTVTWGTEVTNSSESVYIGAAAYPGKNNATNMIVIGAGAVGNGDNTITIGRAAREGVSATLGTYLPAGSLFLKGTPPAIASNTNQLLLRNTSSGASLGEISSLIGSATGQVLKWDGSKWYAGTDEGGSGATGLTSLNGLSASVQTFTQGAGISISSVSPTHTFALTGQALALHNLGTNGLIARTGAGTVAARTITGGSNISVTNGDGVSGNPTIAITGTIPITNGGTGNTNGSAATLTTARTIQTNLGSTTAASFDGSANITPGVTGILPVANGGTGLNSATGYIKGTGAAYTVVNTIPVSEGGTGLGAVNSNGLVLFNNNTTSTDAYTRQTPSLYTASTANPIVWDVNYRSSGIYRITNNSTTNISNVTVSNFVTGGIYAFHIQNASNTIQITVQWPTNFKDLTASTNYGTRVYTTPTIITCYYDGTQFVCE